ncbi:type 1 glutamine amidotransferase domain-containing protein [Clostridium pasteurianum]|uniref:Putative intracellular protease/amidase n=1 Tax=Clostridium pasteurianum BC1 TaxID=86416 RepID=R4K753_CLOPA|nr:type 1 glutamine amidotransferase domain-containing protein [Clostridium pasteurianum]AGK98403.1 putative intracellular protease/amidase [Clostridium pasteurianum BC1]
MNKKILIPIPDEGFCPTEVAVAWRDFYENGFQVTFSTETGKIGKADPLLLSGVIFGKLGAKPEAISAYEQLNEASEFLKPIQYSDITVNDYDCIYLPGGHAKEMRQYLESEILREKVLSFYKQKKLIGAICHGPIILARTIDPKTGKSILYGHKISALPKILERGAYYATFWKLGTYYRTYPEYVEDEIIRVLKNKKDFIRGKSLTNPFCVEDNQIISARWPVDVHFICKVIVKRLTES